jgi:hypothetical protein
MAKRYKIMEIQPAVVVQCSDIETRKFYYIHIYEGPASSKSFKVYDELDQELKGVVWVSLRYNDVSEIYRASVQYEKGVLELNIESTTPWQKNDSST